MEPLIVYFSSVTENTKKFVEKLPYENRRIPLRSADDAIRGDRPYVLVVPTYGGRVESKSIIPKQVIKFLNEEGNRKNCIGVISSGNINFGPSYLLAGRQVAQKIGVPMVYGFELSGMPGDEEKASVVIEALYRHI